jgi:hypothetical protein
MFDSGIDWNKIISVGDYSLQRHCVRATKDTRQPLVLKECIMLSALIHQFDLVTSLSGDAFARVCTSRKGVAMRGTL